MGGNLQPFTIVSMRGRNPDNPSDRTVGSPTEQRLEPNSQGLCNTLTSVQKDNLVMENFYDFYNKSMKKDGVCGTLTANSNTSFTHCGTFGVIEPQYRIRKLTPKECWRLMDFTDEDFEKAEQVNSNTQLYKQVGNSIVKNVLVAILGQMMPGKEDVYKEI
jgi:DNA (cytosine-5)-methyltransferase 1